MRQSEPKPSIIDRAIEYLSPSWGFRRRFAREALRAYDGGKLDRRTQGWLPTDQPGDVNDYVEVQRLRQRSWDLYRNNKQARKIVNTTLAKVIGKGMRPQSQAIGMDGQPDEEYRRLANKLWTDWQPYASCYGLAGYGGADFLGLSMQTLRTCILSGEILILKRYQTKRTQDKRGAPAPFVLELIAAERLAEDTYGSGQSIENGNYFYRGIEFNERGERVAYWIYDQHPNDNRFWVSGKFNVRRIPADRIIHVYLQDQPGQFRGVPWFAGIMFDLRDVGDLQQNELLASALRACIVAAIKTVNPGGFAGLAGASGAATDDANGNSLVRLQPGSLVKLGQNEEIQGPATQGPNVNVEAFSNFITRTMAGGVPGVKSSTLTGDYRNSSFSSERSADNDAWPEIEQVQHWLASTFYQPVWDELIYESTLSGILPMPARFFDDVDNYTAATWQGPVPRSINPVDDATAAQLKISTRLDSFQNVVASLGGQWRDVLLAEQEVRTFCKEKGIEDDTTNKIYGDMQEPAATQPQDEPAGVNADG